MATFELVLLAWLTAILRVACGSVHHMHHDETETNTFEVKPGAGRQEYVRQLVCYWLSGRQVIDTVICTM